MSDDAAGGDERSQAENQNDLVSDAAVAAGGELVNSIESGDIETSDLAISEGGEPAVMIKRFHQAMLELTGRRGVRNDVSRYEAIAIALADPTGSDRGGLLAGFPPSESPLRYERFFARIYARYDERYVYGAPDLKTVTRRLEWAVQSPALLDKSVADLDYEARVAAE